MSKIGCTRNICLGEKNWWWCGVEYLVAGKKINLVQNIHP